MTADVPLVLLGLGTNQQRNEHVSLALDALTERFGELMVSRVFESEPVGFSGGNNFYNLVVGFHHAIGVSELSRWTKQLEWETGRRPEDPRYGPRKLDIDLLCVGNLCGEYNGVTLPRGEILTSAFVLRPLAERFGDVLHPALQQNYRSLWEMASLDDQPLWPVPFQWQERIISAP